MVLFLWYILLRNKERRNWGRLEKDRMMGVREDRRAREKEGGPGAEGEMGR